MHKELAVNPCLCCQKGEKSVSIKGTNAKYCKECGKYIREIIYKHLSDNTTVIYRRYKSILIQMLKFVKDDNVIINKKLKKEIEELNG